MIACIGTMAAQSVSVLILIQRIATSAIKLWTLNHVHLTSNHIVRPPVESIHSFHLFPYHGY